ncbi:DEAD/DEAH box ATP-dependent RNA helicase, putative [Plasmodium gallinaceum]|uniref:ATP-dependent RNA helicase n=1 Tax=Plasmodium gallinaceum TaxID=5849 RepID=A0A1J1GLP3_PLAGA|nr:DEAD/DEAH box ATP-dependent RNA helicase, putative [Plasmodium gallinaceum]CRG93141.1 DEAD/DEAH box ATP-dependent RNA helicase, putative [Plasmodium gallinaceum]
MLMGKYHKKTFLKKKKKIIKEKVYSKHSIKNKSIKKYNRNNKIERKNKKNNDIDILGLLKNNTENVKDSDKLLIKNKKSKEKKKNNNKNNIPTTELLKNNEEIYKDKEKFLDDKENKNRILELPKSNDILELTKEREHMKIKDENIFDGKFSDLKSVLSESLINNLEKNNFIKTTKIQKMSIPLIFKENDVFLKSMTGSGKTLCYAIPSIQKILNMKEEIKITREMGIFIMVLSPTRELAIQINNLFFNLTKPYPYIVVSCITGGEKKKSEKNRIRKGISILTCTPGRLLDHLEHTKSLKLTYLKTVILDEADKIIFLGTQDKIKMIYDLIKKLKSEEVNKMKEKNKNIRSNFQMIFISATLNHAIKSLASYCLTNNTIWIEKKNVPTNFSINDDIENSNYELPEQLKQYCILIDLKQKFVCLLYMLLDCIKKKKKPVVFLSNHHSVEYFQILLKNLYWPTDVDKKNIEVNKRLNEGITPVLEKEDEKLLRKHLEQNYINSCKEKQNNLVLSYKNINIEDIHEEQEQQFYNINADKHKRIYLFENVNIYILHGNLSKEDRLGNFMDFSKNQNSILLCTDIVSRGVNFNSLNVVIQYDAPQILEEYIHKVGRTARLNNEGSSYLFLLNSEKEFLNVLKKKKIQLKILIGNALINQFKNIYIPSFLKIVGKDILNFLQNHFQSIVKSDKLLIEKSTSAFLCTITSYYSISKNIRNIFNAKNLHLGHLAFTFLLDKTPKEISKHKKQQNYLNIKKQTILNKKEKRLLKSKKMQKYPKQYENFQRKKIKALKKNA